MAVDLTTPQALVAGQFMEHKGYGDIEPYGVDKLDGQPCWYFYYRLPEGRLELEVAYDRIEREWSVLVTTFDLAS